jgi:hypothetical protein
MFIPDLDPDLDFFTHPGYRGQKGTETLVNTASNTRVGDTDKILGSWIQIPIPIRVKSWI